MLIIELVKLPPIFNTTLEGGDKIMKKVLAFILALMLLVAFTFAVGCKKAEEPKAPEAPAAPAPAPAPAPEAPAPAPEKPAEAPKK